MNNLINKHHRIIPALTRASTTVRKLRTYSRKTSSQNNNAPSLVPLALITGTAAAIGIVAAVNDHNETPNINLSYTPSPPVYQNGIILATSAKLEPEAPPPPSSTPPAVAASADDDDDDYSDLPEKDEPTTCVICLINRQGPCRNPWRRFEKCMKDNHSDDDDSDEKKNDVVTKCSNASLKWLKCLDNYRVTYAILTNKHYQPEIDALEGQFTDDDGSKSDFPVDMMPSLDLNHWYEHCEAMEDEFIDDDDDDDDDEASSPTPPPPENFIAGYAKFKIKQAAKERVIDMAFVKDQNGTVIGFDHFGREKREEKDHGELIFHLTPETTSITLFAVYKNEPPSPPAVVADKSDNDDDDDDDDEKNTTVAPPPEQTKGDDSETTETTVADEDKGQLYVAVTSVLPKPESNDHDE